MEDQKNFGNKTESNIYNNYYSQTDSNIDINQERNITNKAKEMIKSFKNQYLSNIEKSPQICPTEINQNSQNYKSYQLLPGANKAREELNSYDYLFSSNKGVNPNLTPTKNKYQYEKPIPNVEIMSRENAKLKNQLMDLVIENKNLKNRINNNFPSPLLIKDNFSGMNSFNMQNQVYRGESDNNMEMNKNRNAPKTDKRFMEESIESVIQTNTRLGGNNNIEIKRNYNIKKYGNNSNMGFAKSNTNFNTSSFNSNNYNPNNININPNENINAYANFSNNYINGKYYDLLNDYNQLLEEYKNNKNKLVNLQGILENQKGLSNKYRILNNNYIDLQNRNKELIITIQKMKNDNSVLQRHIGELNKKTKNLENNLKSKSKNKSNNNDSHNISELKVLKSKYTELQKYIEDIMREKQEVDKNERKKKK